jgi:hypothetical protein
MPSVEATNGRGENFGETIAGCAPGTQRNGARHVIPSFSKRNLLKRMAEWRAWHLLELTVFARRQHREAFDICLPD